MNQNMRKDLLIKIDLKMIIDNFLDEINIFIIYKFLCLVNFLNDFNELFV